MCSSDQLPACWNYDIAFIVDIDYYDYFDNTPNKERLTENNFCACQGMLVIELMTGL